MLEYDFTEDFRTMKPVRAKIIVVNNDWQAESKNIEPKKKEAGLWQKILARNGFSK